MIIFISLFVNRNKYNQPTNMEISNTKANKIREFVLNIAKKHIKTDFDHKDKINKTINNINFENNIYIISIIRNCYFQCRNNKPYFEDYLVNFNGNFENIKIRSTFYLEWKEDIVGSELIPSNTRYDPNTNTLYNRNIKIKIIN